MQYPEPKLLYPGVQYPEPHYCIQVCNILNPNSCIQVCNILNPNSADNIKQMARSLFLLGRHRLAIEAYRYFDHIKKVSVLYPDTKNITRLKDMACYTAVPAATRIFCQQILCVLTGLQSFICCVPTLFNRQAESRCSDPDWEIFHNLGVCHTYLREWDQAADLLRYSSYTYLRKYCRIRQLNYSGTAATPT